MEDNKYYIPSIDEFFVGFEYEMYNSESHIWESKVIKNSEHLCYFLFDSNNRTWREDCKDVVRVKYLDKSDIESCGFKAELNAYQEMSADSQWHADLIKEDGTTVVIHFWTYDYDNNINPKVDSPLTVFKNNTTRYNWKKRCWANEPAVDLVFNGKVKNLSELRKLLKQIGIE
jgi:hypothetical protein